MRFLLAVVALLLLTSCDADKWKIKSNPSGDAPHPDGGLVVVIVKSTLPTQREASSGPSENHEAHPGERDPVQVYLLTGVHDEDLADGDGTIRGRSLMQLETAH